MSNIEFILNGRKTLIQCNTDEKLKDICLRYSTKIPKDLNTLLFLYGGNKINPELNFNQLANKFDKERKKMTLLVNEINQINLNPNLKKAKEIICPQCKENIRYKIDNYKITLYECKNGHKINNLSLSEFESTQYIDEEEIKCDNCNQNKANTYINMFYMCFSCNRKLCPLCKSNHNKSHIIINYDNKNYYCELHNDLFSSYCNQCNKNICMICENEHENHDIIYFKKILPNEDEIKKELKELRNKIDIMNDNINSIIKIFYKISEYLETLYQINNDIINNYNIKNRNFQILQNINEINNKHIINDINNIINENRMDLKIKFILELYYKIQNNNDNKEEEIDELNIIYKNDKDVETIHIFGSDFVKNNKDKCKIIYNDKEYELTEEFCVKNCKENILEIKLKGIKNITNMSYMFKDCSLLLSLPNFEKCNTINVTKMTGLFLGCSSLLYLPDISKWDISNVTDISAIFYNCSSLKSLPDISKWNTININNMQTIFDKLTLKYLPDISNWNTSKVKYMNGIFENCSLLESLPDISKWDTNNVINMGCMFYNCSSLKSLPDISNWNTSNVVEMYWMFRDCSSLSSLPDISKWNINNLKDKENMFDGCTKLLNIPSQFI